MKNMIFGLMLMLSIGSCSVLQEIALQPSTYETISAVKEVMNSSAFRAIAALQKMGDGGVEAFLPKEIQPVLNTMKTLGLGKEIDKVSGQIGSVAKIVGSEGSGIMADAIKEVDLGDAVSIVVGGEDAATAVLKQAMYATVKKRYSTRIDAELDKSGPEAKQYWPMAVGAYNMFSDNKIEGTLSDFIAERSVDAAFLAMGKEEGKIRKDPASLGKDVVTKVWDYYNKK